MAQSPQRGTMGRPSLAAEKERAFFAHPMALVETDEIGENTRVWAFAHILPGARIGSDCNICDHAFIESGVTIGSGVTVKNGVAIWSGVTIEDDVFLGPNCVFTNDPNPRAHIKKPSSALVPTRVRTGATIGANATIVCGTSIGEHAFIGAGAVVLRSVPDFALMVGNPVRQIGWICICGERLPRADAKDIGTLITCSACQRRFSISPNGLSPQKN